MNSIQGDRCVRLLRSSCFRLGSSSGRGFQQHLHMWRRISATSRSTKTKQLSGCSAGKIFYGFSKDVCECAEKREEWRKWRKAAGDSLSELK